MDAIVWLRQDLRIRDNPALYHAHLEQKGVIPLYILDTKTFGETAASSGRGRFIYRTLQNLMSNLEKRDSRLIVRLGDPRSALATLISETGAAAVYMNRRYHPRLYKEDEAIAKWLRDQDIEVKIFHDETVFPPDAIKEGRKPFTRFAPYRDAWLQTELQKICPNIERLKHVKRKKKGLKTLNEIKTEALPDLASFGFTVAGKIPTAGEDEALDLISWFFDKRVMFYASQRIFPQMEGTSKISPHITNGSISPRLIIDMLTRVWERATPTQKNSVDNWLVSYIWRDFFHQLLYHFPKISQEPFHKQFKDFPFENDPKYITALENAETGIPIVDAAMRQMKNEFWMHGRLRVLLASFIVKDLLIDWRHGLDLFRRYNIDFDEATAAGSFQWVASFGAESLKAFEIIDLVQQSRSLDPEGYLIKNKIPELAKVPKEHIHAPWLMPKELQTQIGVVIGKQYPKPIVKLGVNARKFNKIYEEL